MKLHATQCSLRPMPYPAAFERLFCFRIRLFGFLDNPSALTAIPQFYKPAHIRAARSLGQAVGEKRQWK
ncbi:hypothetical protein SQ11_13675 [Nitrosospira sp. NpAV]|nr:hypothetical protein SQ11_13675 [Nitrosospira sp. NpAV]